MTYSPKTRESGRAKYTYCAQASMNQVALRISMHISMPSPLFHPKNGLLPRHTVRSPCCRLFGHEYHTRLSYKCTRLSHPQTLTPRAQQHTALVYSHCVYSSHILFQRGSTVCVCIPRCEDKLMRKGNRSSATHASSHRTLCSVFALLYLLRRRTARCQTSAAA